MAGALGDIRYTTSGVNRWLLPDGVKEVLYTNKLAISHLLVHTIILDIYAEYMVLKANKRLVLSSSMFIYMIKMSHIKAQK